MGSRCATNRSYELVKECHQEDGGKKEVLAERLDHNRLCGIGCILMRGSSATVKLDSMWQFLRRFDREFRQAAELAKEHVASCILEARVHGVSLRAEEAERWVFAVFYTTPSLIVKPTPYQLVTVSKSTKIAEELPRSSGSPYVIRGRK
jgi:hypothetical protein